LPGGTKITKTDYFNKHGLSSKLNHEVDDAVYFRRVCELPGCDNANIVIDHRGFAYCPVCKTIYNEGQPPIRKKTSEQVLKVSAIRKQNYKASIKKLAKC
jgi:hypothetical protein